MLHTNGEHGTREKTLHAAFAVGAALNTAAPATTVTPASPWSARMGASSRVGHGLASAATWTLSMRSGSTTGSPFLILSTTSMPDTTSPMTVYWPLREGVSLYIMKNWLLAELLSPPLRAMPTTPRLNGTLENSAGRLGYFEPPLPSPFWPSPVCAMKSASTRWNGTLS